MTMRCWRTRPSPERRRSPPARDVAHRLAQALGLPSDYVITAHEDVPQLLQQEAALPANVDPLDADLSQSDERARLARLLQGGLDKPAGFVLPLKATTANDDEAPSSGKRAAGRCAASASI